MERYVLQKGQVISFAGNVNARMLGDELNEYISTLKEGGVAFCPFIYEWAEAEPVKGIFDTYYTVKVQYVLKALKEAGISPQVILFAGGGPQWFVKDGGFLSPSGQEDYLSYVRRTAEALQDLAYDFITFDEPNEYAFKGWLIGSEPPFAKSRSAYKKCLENIAACHIAAYELLHRYLGEEIKVSFTMNAKVFSPANCSGKEADQYAALRGLSAFRAMSTGSSSRPVRIKKNLDGDCADYISLSYEGGFYTDGKKEASEWDGGRSVRPAGSRITEWLGAISACGLGDKPVRLKILKRDAPEHDLMLYYYEAFREISASRLDIGRVCCPDGLLGNQESAKYLDMLNQRRHVDREMAMLFGLDD